MKNKTDLKYLWDEKNPQGYYNKSGFYKTKKELNFIAYYLKDINSKILDLGGGSGRFALPLIKMGFDVTVVDLNIDAIDLCKMRGIEKAYRIDIREFEERNFDLVLAIELFLVTKPSDVIQVASRALKQNGLFITVGTNKESWRYKLHNLRKKKSKNFGELSLNEYKNIINRYGFEIIEIKGFNWMPFKVNSNNLFIPLVAKFESLFGLDKWLNQSPWLLFACMKK